VFPISDHNPTHSRPHVTHLLIAANVIAFLFTWWLEAHGVTWIPAGYGMVPARVMADPSGEAVKIFTSMFLHADFMHLLWNMIFLYIFGDNVEDVLGRSKFVLFYFVAGCAGALGQLWVGPESSIPMVGASGAIAGVLGGYLVLFPRAPITLINPVPLLWLIMGPFFILPAWMAVGWWFLGNLMGGLASLGGAETSTAFFAHLGGFTAGLIMTRPMMTPQEHTKESWRGDQSPPRVPRGKIFRKDRDGPFWQN
jgi:membrane associated rhomboid family serine protease